MSALLPAVPRRGHFDQFWANISSNRVRTYDLETKEVFENPLSKWHAVECELNGRLVGQQELADRPVRAQVLVAAPMSGPRSCELTSHAQTFRDTIGVRQASSN